MSPRPASVGCLEILSLSECWLKLQNGGLPTLEVGDNKLNKQCLQLEVCLLFAKPAKLDQGK